MTVEKKNGAKPKYSKPTVTTFELNPMEGGNVIRWLKCPSCNCNHKIPFPACLKWPGAKCRKCKVELELVKTERPY